MGIVINLADRVRTAKTAKTEALNITVEELFSKAAERNKAIKERLQAERLQKNKNIVKELNNGR